MFSRETELQKPGIVVSFDSVFVLVGKQGDDVLQKESRMKDKKNKKDKRDKKSMKAPKKDLKTAAVPVPPAATELSEENLKRVTGGAGVEYWKEPLVDKSIQIDS